MSGWLGVVVTVAAVLYLLSALADYASRLYLRRVKRRCAEKEAAARSRAETAISDYVDRGSDAAERFANKPS